MSFHGLDTFCTKHPNQKMTLLSTTSGVRKCPLCVVKDSIKSQNPQLKNRFCLKHPGYEKLFFCEEDMKGICERCLDLHQDHKVYTLALQSRQLRRQYAEFKMEFQSQVTQWDEIYHKLEKSKKAMQAEVDRVQTEVEQVFDSLIQVLVENKQLYVNKYKQKCDLNFKDFYKFFDTYLTSYKEVTQTKENIQNLDEKYTNNQINDYDLVKEHILNNNGELFKNYCSEIEQEFTDYMDQLEGIKTNISQSMKFKCSDDFKTKLENLIKEVVHIHIEQDSKVIIPIQSSELDSKSLLNQSMSSSNTVFMNITEQENNNRSTVAHHLPRGHNDEQYHIQQESIIDDRNSQQSSQFAILDDRNEEIKREGTEFSKSLTIRLSTFNNKKIQSVALQKLFNSVDQLIHIVDRKENILLLIDQQNQTSSSLSHLPIKEFKSVLLDKQVFIFEYSDSQLTGQIFKYNSDINKVLPLDCQLRPPRKRLNICPVQNKYIYFTGEFENIKTDRSIIERFDINTQTFDEIYGLSISQAPFILCCVNDRLLYAIPVAINTQKVHVLDLKQLDETQNFAPSKRVYMHPTKQNAFIPKWAKINHKLPLNFKVSLSVKSCAIQVNFEEILVTGQKTSYIYNFKKDEFTHYINNTSEDEFLDCLYRNESKTTQVFGCGSKGMHVFDCMARKWQLYDELKRSE